MNHLTIHEAIDDFLLAARADRLRPATIDWYTSILRAFSAHFTGPVETVTTRQIREYIAGLRDRQAYRDAPQRPIENGKLSDSTIAAHVRALHAFWAFCAREYKIENPMKNIRRVRTPDPVPKAIEPSDFIKLFEATDDTAMGVRNRAILAFLADTGCRLQAIAGLKMGDVDLAQCQAQVTEKGGRVRTVVFTHMTARFLFQWLNVRAVDGDSLFGLTKSGIYQVLKRLKKKTGVKGRTNPHSFRHNFARAYLLNGGDLVSLTRLLGHSDIQTTADYYAIFDQTELKDLQARFSPLRSMIGKKEK